MVSDYRWLALLHEAAVRIISDVSRGVYKVSAVLPVNSGLTFHNEVCTKKEISLYFLHLIPGSLDWIF